MTHRALMLILLAVIFVGSALPQKSLFAHSSLDAATSDRIVEELIQEAKFLCMAPEYIHSHSLKYALKLGLEQKVTGDYEHYFSVLKFVLNFTLPKSDQLALAYCMALFINFDIDDPVRDRGFIDGKLLAAAIDANAVIPPYRIRHVTTDGTVVYEQLDGRDYNPAYASIEN